MARTLSVANQKGGVGKTTTVINLSEALARGGQQTLVVDLDPQCNATTGFGRKPLNEHPLLGDAPLRHWIEPISERLDLLPGSRSFRDVDSLAKSGIKHSDRLIEQLRNGSVAYDFVIIDCPPSMGQLTQMALTASSEVLMPIQCEYFAMEGLVGMIEVIRDIMNTRPGELQFGGIVLTMYDSSLELTAEVDREVREFFGEIVFDTVIPRDARLSESPSHGCSVLKYAPRSRGARAYIELCMEVMEHG